MSANGAQALNAPSADTMPRAISAERAVLGAMLLSEEAADCAMEALDADCFYSEPHRVLWKALAALRERNCSIDPFTLENQLSKEGLLDRIGGVAFIFDVAGCVPTAANIEHHARIVREKYRLRQLHQLCLDGTEATAGNVSDASVLLDEFENRVMRIGEQKQRTARRIGEYVPGYIQDLEKRAAEGGGIKGVRTGFVDLDRMMGGLQEGDLCVVAGYPSHGKSAFALQVALNAVRSLPQSSGQMPVAFFSLEMAPETQLMQRMESNISGVPMDAFMLAKFTDQQWGAVISAANEIHGLPLFVEHAPGGTLLELRAKARRLKRAEGAKLVIVDYLQLVVSKHENRQQEVAAVARGLKNLAGELGLPVMALAQLNREAVKRADPTPTRYDLRESGEIEQAADQVLCVYRPGKERQTVKDELGAMMPIPESESWLILDKHRNGQTGRVYANFDGATQSFTSRANHYE